MADSTPTYTELTAGIDALAAMTSPESVTPVLEAGLMRQMAAYFERCISDHAGRLDILATRSEVTAPPNMAGHCPTLDESGRLRLSQLPAIPKTLLPSDTVYSSAIPSAIVSWLWAIMANDGRLYQPFVNLPESPAAAIPQGLENGYYPDLYPERPFFIYGGFYSLQQAAQILLDRWMPGTGGVMMMSRVNLPQELKATDSRITLAYTATNNWRPQVICLGAAGVDSEVRPISMHRAFHGAGDLRAVLGVISLENIPNSYEMLYAFANAPQLRFILLKWIPDCIAEIDLSGCSPDLIKPLSADVRTGENGGTYTGIRPAIWILENIDDSTGTEFQRDPDLPLTIAFPAAMQTIMLHDPAVRQIFTTALNKARERFSKLLIDFR